MIEVDIDFYCSQVASSSEAVGSHSDLSTCVEGLVISCLMTLTMGNGVGSEERPAGTRLMTILA